MRIHMWLLFIECLLYTKSFMFISTFFIPFFHFICISPSRNLRLRGVKSPNWCYKATECQIWIESRSAWLWSLRENSCGIQVNASLSWYQVTCVAHMSDWVHLMVNVCFENWQFHLSLDLREEVYEHPLGQEPYASWMPVSCKSPSDLLGGSLRALTPLLVKHLFVFLPHQMRRHGLE